MALKCTSGEMQEIWVSLAGDVAGAARLGALLLAAKPVAAVCGAGRLD